MSAPNGRMTPESEAEIRAALRTGRKKVSYVFIGRDLLAELDAVRAERDEAIERAADGDRCRSTWNGRRCRDTNGHAGIHVAEDESDWIDGDNDPAPSEDGMSWPSDSAASDESGKPKEFHLRNSCCLPLHLSGSNTGGICILDAGHDGPCEGF